jgi:hypothetical protein
MKKLILAVIGAVLIAYSASSVAVADCDSDPGNPPNSFE